MNKQHILCWGVIEENEKKKHRRLRRKFFESTTRLLLRCEGLWETSSDVSSCGKTHKKVATKLKSKKTRENLSTILRRQIIECVELTYLSKEGEPKLLISKMIENQ